MPAFDPASSKVLHAGTAIALDHAKGDACFSSHAHSDHSSFLHRAKSVYASSETIALWEARSGKQFKGELLEESDGVRLLEAGHVLGARQIFLQGDGASFAYTGDFCASRTATCAAAAVPQCDELVVESTFGLPKYVFPERGELEEKIGKWASALLDKNENVVLGGYSLGKAQELIKIVNNCCGAAPLVDENIARVSKTYSKSGCFLDFVEIGSSEGERLLKKPFISVLPMNSVNYQLAATLSDHYGRPTATAVATGWALDGNSWGVDEAFPLSDHSDFPALLEFVLQTGAKKVFCTHGFEREFAAELQKRGVNAMPLGHAAGKERSGEKNKVKPVKTLVEYT